MPSPFVRRSPKVKRLIPNFREVEKDYFRRTKIFPIMHTMVVREEVYEKYPWVAQSLFKAFAESKRICQESDVRVFGPQIYAGMVLRRDGERNGASWRRSWAYGLEANRHILETLMQYSHEQGLIKKLLELKSLFARTRWKNLKFSDRSKSETRVINLYGRRKNSAL